MHNPIKHYAIIDLSKKLKEGKIIAYPTEAVFGLGCDPGNEEAVLQLCALKQRTLDKGLILVAANFDLLMPFLDISQLTEAQLKAIESSWPGPVTWVMPCFSNTPYFLKGQFDTIAVRVSAHPIVKSLSEEFNGPIVSTSANLSGREPAKSALEVYEQFGDRVFISEGHIGELAKPTMIKEALTGRVLRS